MDATSFPTQPISTVDTPSDAQRKEALENTAALPKSYPRRASADITTSIGVFRGFPVLPQHQSSSFLNIQPPYPSSIIRMPSCPALGRATAISSESVVPQIKLRQADASSSESLASSGPESPDTAYMRGAQGLGRTPVDFVRSTSAIQLIVEEPEETMPWTFTPPINVDGKRSLQKGSSPKKSKSASDLHKIWCIPARPLPAKSSDQSDNGVHESHTFERAYYKASENPRQSVGARFSIAPNKMTLRQLLDEQIAAGLQSIVEKRISYSLPESPWQQDKLVRVFAEEKTLSALLGDVVLPRLEHLNTMIKKSDPKSPCHRLCLQAMMKKMRAQLEPFLTPDPDYIPKPDAPVAFKVAEELYEGIAFEIRNLFQEAHILGRLSTDPEILKKATAKDLIEVRSQLLTHMMGVLGSVIDTRRTELKSGLVAEDSDSFTEADKASNLNIQDKRAMFSSCKKMLEALKGCSSLARENHAVFDLYAALFYEVQFWIAGIDTLPCSTQACFDQLQTLFGMTALHTKHRSIAEPALSTLLNLARRLKTGEDITQYCDSYCGLMVDMKHLDSKSEIQPNRELLSVKFTEKLTISKKNKKKHPERPATP